MSSDPLESILKSIVPQASYEKKNIQHTIRLETDVLEICKPKSFKKRYRMFSEKIVIVHKKENDTYDILDIK